ncbi:MAG TPA: DUF4286 family protein [Bacteroidia bacterium]|jgi:hypothetical protein|nr:DUF4286 family protein [Bacteroidia bacterium]
MILYNVTVNIDDSVHDEWLQWMKEKHIPDVVNTGCFSSGTIFRLLVDEESGTSYSVQYRAPNRFSIDRYMKEFAAALQKEHKEKYEGKFVAFRTLLEEV